MGVAGANRSGGRSCLQSVRIARRNAMRVTARAAARPWRHLGLPTPKRVRMSKARLSPAMCTRSRLAMVDRSVLPVADGGQLTR